MGFDVMSAWKRTAFDFNDDIQGRDAVWASQKRFNNPIFYTLFRAEYEPPSPPTSSHSTPAPDFQVAKSQWSPPRSRSPTPPTSPRADSAHPAEIHPPEPAPLVPTSLASKFYHAACAGDIPHLQLLLSLGADVDTPTLVEDLYDTFKPAKSGLLSPLAGAAGHGHLSTVQLLLSHGAALNPSMKQSSSSPLHQACKADDPAMAAYLLSLGADVNVFNCFNVTPLMYAAKYASAATISVVLAYRPHLHVASFIQTAAIHWAIWPGHEDVIERLLEAGADPNHPMGDGSTPVHCAAMTGAVGVLKVLMKWGGDAERRKSDGVTPLDVAVGEKAVKVLRRSIARRSR